MEELQDSTESTLLVSLMIQLIDPTGRGTTAKQGVPFRKVAISWWEKMHKLVKERVYKSWDWDYRKTTFSDVVSLQESISVWMLLMPETHILAQAALCGA